MNTQYKDIMSVKIFLEQINNKHQMRFRDLFNLLKDFLIDNNINYKKYHPSSDKNDCEVSTWTLCSFAVLKTFSSNPEQKEFIIKYINKLAQQINQTNYMEEANSLSTVASDFFQVLKSVFDNPESDDDEDEPTQNSPVISDNYIDFDYVFNLLRKISSSYHDDYIILLCVGTLGFTNLILDYPNRFELFNSYLSNLIEMIKLDDTYGFYDNANFRGYVEF